MAAGRFGSVSVLVLLLQACGVWSMAGQGGQMISDKPTFKAYRNLPSLRCNSQDAIGIGRRPSDLLNTDAKLDAFAATLPSEQRTFFNQLRNSPDHSFSPFTEDEARLVFTFLYLVLDDQGKTFYINLRTMFDQVDYSSIVDAVKNWDPAVHLLMTKDAHCTAIGKMNETLLGYYCSRFIEEKVPLITFLATVERCGDCVALGVERRMDDTIIGALSDAKCEAYLNKVKQYKPNGWDVYYMTWCPQAVVPGDINRITDSNFCDAAQQTRLKEVRFTNKLRVGVLRKIGRKLIGCIGDLSTWTTQQVGDFAPYVANLPREQLLTVTDLSKFLSNYDAFAAVPNILQSRLLRVVGYKVADWWSANSGSLDTDTKNKLICIVMKFAPDRRLVKQLITKSELESALATLCSDFNLTPEEVKDIVIDIVTQPGFTWDSTKLTKLGSYVGGLPASLVSAIPTNVLCDNWATVKTAKIGRAGLAYIWEKCKSTFANPSTFTCNKIKEAGVLLRAIPKSDVQNVPNSVLAECIVEIAPILEPLCQRRRGLCKLVMTKVAAHAGASIDTYIKDIGANLARSISSVSSVDLSDLGGVDNLANVDFSGNKVLANAVWKKIKTLYGEVTRNNLKYCGEDFKKVAKVFYAAATGQEWENLCEDESLLDNIARAAPDIQKLGGRVIRAIVQKLLGLFGAAGDSKAVCIDGPLIDQVASFLPHAKGKDLAKFNTKTLQYFIRKVGQRKELLDYLPRGQMKFITKIAMKIEGITTTISAESVDRTGPYVWCGLVAADVNKLADDVIKKYGQNLMECNQLDLDTSKEIVKRFQILTNSVGPSAIEEYGSKILIALNEISDAQLTTDMKKLLAANVPRLMSAVDEFFKMVLKKDDREVPAAEKESLKALMKTSLGRLFSILVEVDASARRRKRTTGTADCSTLTSLGTNLDFLTDSQISGIETSEVKGCLAQLSETVWDSAQCVAWRAHLVHASGLGTTVSSWNKADVQSLGTLVDCLTSAEVQSLPVDDDVIQALGAVELTKSSDVMTAYLATTGTTVSAMTEDKLSDFGNMICGLSSSDIGSMPDSVVHGSAKDLNSVGCMDQAQITAVANKIVAVEGSDWSNTDPIVVDEFGQYIGGLSESVLGTFTTEHVKAIVPAAIQAMPPTTLANAFSADAFAAMSSEQSNSITEAQLNQLSPAQKTNVEANANFNVAVTLDNLDNNNGARSFSVLTGVTTVLLTSLTVTFLL